MTNGVLYIIFAALATIVNLLTQEVTSNLFQNDYELVISILTGTLAGLVLKYYLDKTFIFKFRANNQAHNFTTFFSYSLMGGATTILFWVTEYAFDMIYGTKTMRYVGAVIGLTLGYASKYYLDKKFVFIER